jgi:phenylpropionate dioxygenase-like ring-hydroxylating dioxygenase large terminal subunit
MRCVYHGWKFDLTGQCVDVPNNPTRLDIKDKVKLKAYRAVEQSGVVWVYMGEQSNPPSLPAFEFMDLDPDDLNIVFVQRECNFMQSLEGDIDTSHLGFLHVGNIEPEQLDPEDLMRHVVSNRVPELSVGDAPWGTQYCAQKSINEGQHYLRYANFLFPFWTQVPQGEFETNIIARAWVPMDDTHTMSIAFGWKRRPPPFKTMANGEPLPGDKPAPQLANGSGWFERFRPIQNLANDYLIDRDAQMTDRIYTGIENINIQDHAVTESMGAITDRTRERLTPSDLMIVRTRRRLLQAARELKEQGTLPPGLDDSSIYRDARSGELVVTTNDPWPQTYQRELKQALRAEHINSVQP